MKTWVKKEITNQEDQILLIQPAPGFDAIEIYFKNEDIESEPFYITEEELPVIIDNLQQMMLYVTKK